jgi:hypothetical protein
MPVLTRSRSPRSGTRRTSQHDGGRTFTSLAEGEATVREPVFRRPAQAQRCRWLLWFLLTCIYECVCPLGARPGASVPPSKPCRPLNLKEPNSPS